MCLAKPKALAPCLGGAVLSSWRRLLGCKLPTLSSSLAITGPPVAACRLVMLALGGIDGTSPPKFKAIVARFVPIVHVVSIIRVPAA